MKRREFAGLCAGMVLHGLAHAGDAVTSESINMAGRQRMLSQRMAKAWLAVVLKVPGKVLPVLEQSMATFEQQLAVLSNLDAGAEIRSTYASLSTQWARYKAVLQTSPSADKAAQLLAEDAKVLALAHQATNLIERAANKPTSKLVNVAGAQRMLSQRMAKLYYAKALGLDAEAKKGEINQARNDFKAAMAMLRQAPQNTPAIVNELTLGEHQWVFLELALSRSEQPSPQLLSDVFSSSENLLTVMDRVTKLYAALP